MPKMHLSIDTARKESDALKAVMQILGSTYTRTNWLSLCSFNMNQENYTPPKRVLDMCKNLEARRSKRISQRGNIVRYLADQIVSAMERINELTPEGEIGILVPSVDDVITEAEIRFHKPPQRSIE